MAQNNNQNSSSSVVTNMFTKGLNKDLNETFLGEGVWTHARNAVNNSHTGNLGGLITEPSNLHCIDLPYTLIGAIALNDDEWILFTTDNNNSEIGIFDESKCSYSKIVNDPCLNFNTSNLITGAYRDSFDCGRKVYFDDGHNPSRVLDIDKVPYICEDPLEPVTINYYNYFIRRKPSPSVLCGQNFNYSGGKGEFSYDVNIGSTYGVVTLSYDALNIPDKFRVVYDGVEVINTGFRGQSSYNNKLPEPVKGPGAGTATFIKHSKTSIATVYVDAPLGNTLWGAILSCPVPDGTEPPPDPGEDIKYKDSSDIRQTLSLDYDESRTICALEGSIVISKPDDYTLEKRGICHSRTTFKKKVGCIVPVCTDKLDCEKLRLAPLLTIPKLTLKKGKGSGTLPNGSYQIAVAYTVNQIRVTDYLALSEVQPLFSHENLSGALELSITNTDTEFDELEVAVISTVNAQTVVKRLGIYSTRQNIIYIDTIDPSLNTIPLSSIPLRTPAIEKSDSMYEVNNYLLRVGIYTKPDINYQPQANKIKTKWVSVEYPADYYRKGGNKASNMRDEVYPYFIRWIYNTGDKSASYHIPGRESDADDLSLILGPDAIELEDGQSADAPQRWQVYNTASVTSVAENLQDDGGKIIAEGEMSYWESSEKYPDTTPEIWGSLCGKNIRHHKFPDNSTALQTSHFNSSGKTINILGVKFEGITHPLDSSGNPIMSIVGYEILRGSREGNKSIIAKGIINNMREFDIAGSSSQKGLFVNYPYNDLRPDGFLTPEKQTGTNGKVNPTKNLLSGYRKDIFSFHSPEISFSRPFLSGSEIKLYQELYGKSVGRFETPYKHPKFKVTTNADDVIAGIVGVLSALNIFTNGVEIGSTEDYPIGLKIGPLPPLPFNSATLPVVGTSSGGGSAPGAIAYNTVVTALQGVNFITSLVSIVATMGKFAELEKEKFFSLMRTLIPKVQYAVQYNSHGFYTEFKPVPQDNTRRLITAANYLGSNIQSFEGEYQVNNLHRSNAVVVKLSKDVAEPSVQDTSRKTMSEAGLDKYTDFESTISTYYAAIKVNLPSQYGQIDSIKQIPLGSEVFYTEPVKSKKFNTSVLFGGDVYINRFTEKNSFFYFYDWLFGQPDEYQYDYSMYINIPYPRFWINNEQYNRSLLKVSSDYRVLDGRDSSTFYVKKGWFYLFNSGVRDFFVESEVNLALRDWDDDTSKRHYDPYEYTDISNMFRSDIIKSNNYYKYDYSLSNSRIFNSYISWGSVTDRDFDPLTAEKCYSYYPRRVMYSLPQETEFKKDNWKTFLPNNYKDFSSTVTSVKPINKSGALIMMKNESPMQFMGVDSLQTDAGTKVTIGDGGLFNQSLQNIVNSDKSYQYGSCQNKFSVAGTPYGVFYISQDQGKIFNYSGGLDEISRYGNKFWFSRYLPSELLKVFPDYKLFDNPVEGIGCQVVYDNTNEIVYFSRKDYKPINPDIKLNIETQEFYLNDPSSPVALTDTTLFEDASWTYSYDPKNKAWLSFHDWHPSLMLPGKNHFATVINEDQEPSSIWKHNVRFDSFCNFYGKDYPFEVEFVSATGQNVNILRSVEYLLEAYQYSQNGQDKYHVLDHNFDRAIIYNSEQVSGNLKLNISPKNNPLGILSYPRITGNGIDILYSKEENKYRFNQFYDVTKDRGEFSNIPRMMFITKANGYVFQINPNYVDYSKTPAEHKKFRHNVNKIFLRRNVNGNTQIVFKIFNTKTLSSPR